MLHFNALESNSIHRSTRSPIVKGLTAEEGIGITIVRLITYVAAAVFFVLGLKKFALVLALIIFLVTRFVAGLLRYFHRTEKQGFLISFISYHFNQPKRIYASKSKDRFKGGNKF
jgi:hypothetical protein